MWDVLFYYLVSGRLCKKLWEEEGLLVGNWICCCGGNYIGGNWVVEEIGRELVVESPQREDSTTLLPWMF
jgi:hypothetical protein